MLETKKLKCVIILSLYHITAKLLPDFDPKWLIKKLNSRALYIIVSYMLETKILKCVIILSLYHITATDFFHHGADDCINKLNSYFHQMKGGARVQLDKNKS